MRSKSSGVHRGLTKAILSWSALLLLVLGWLVLGAGLLIESGRGGAEQAIRAYLGDLEAHRLDLALSALPPESTARWRDFLEFQQFNHYEIVSISVRSPSLLESVLTHQPWQPTSATLVADVVEPSGTRWRGSTVIPLELMQGRWLLSRPPFAP